MKKEKAVVWFRNDLRVRDNFTLYEAVRSSEMIYPVYCLDSRQFSQTELGFRKTDHHRARFLLESLEELKKNLQEIGSDLIILRGRPEDNIPDFCRKIQASLVFASKETTREEVNVEKAVEDSLFKMGGDIQLIWQSTLFHEDDIPWPIGKLPDVFTKFRKENEKATPIREEVMISGSLKNPENIYETPVPSLEDLGFESGSSTVKTVYPWKGGEKEAWNRIKEYFWNRNQLKNYKYTRNGLLGEDYSSKLSPWLALGCISPRSIYHEVKRYEKEIHKNVSTYWLVFELIWRDYFRFVAKKYGDRIFLKGGIKNLEKNYENDPHKFSSWINGMTGIPFIDANMRELKSSGFMSNRGRQNVASFLVKDLNVDWRWGAAWFESQLIDYDVCSNWGNWMYNAGVGNDPRENRYFNIASQAQKYDSKGEYVRHWIPELASIPGYKIHFPFELEEHVLASFGIQLGVDYPRPIIDVDHWLVSL